MAPVAASEFALRFADRWSDIAHRLGDGAEWIHDGIHTWIEGRFDAVPVDAELGSVPTGIRAPTYTTAYTSFPRGELERGQQILLGGDLYDIVDTDHRGRVDRSGEWVLTLRAAL